MTNILIPFIASLVSLVVIDYIWLSLTADFYKERLAHLFAESFSYGPAAFFYPIYALALTMLVVAPALRGGSNLLTVALLSALLGLAAYGAYDLTNAATLRNWPHIVTFIDIGWGVTFTALCGAISYWVTRLLL